MGQNGALVFLPPKFEFVFYEQKMEMYKKGNLERTINYEDIKEIVVMKKWQNNVFIKIEKDKKIIIKIYDNGSVIKSYAYNFQTNVINSIPETNIKFAIALEQDNDEYINFFINRHTTDNDNCTSPTRTLFPGLTNTYSFCRYVF